MTLVMQDSITVADLTSAADAYLGYVNGNWPTYAAVVARFPHKPVLSMAVAAGADAEGCDCEAGDLTIAQVPAWVKRQLSRGVAQPVVYASASIMGAVLSALQANGIARAQVRLLSAHYAAGQHICGPGTCAYPGVPACDGTQWTDSASGTGGTAIDESILHDGFFSGGDMAISKDDLAAIAKAVWTVDGIIPASNGNKNNRFWQPQRVLADLATQARSLEVSVAAVAKKAGVDTNAVVTGVLKGLDPSELADAIAVNLGPDVGQRVITALQARLAAPAPPRAAAAAAVPPPAAPAPAS